MFPVILYPLPLRVCTLESNLLTFGIMALDQSPPHSTSLDSRQDDRPISINQRLRLHNRERLVVRPLYWTRRHLELLGCSFGEPQPGPLDVQPKLTGDRNGRDFIAAMIHSWTNFTRDKPLVLLVAETDTPLMQG